MGDDWREAKLDELRALIREVDPAIVEERKWRKPTNPDGVAAWSRGGLICTGEKYRGKVKLTFAKGARLDDPAGLFNASLDGNARRAIDLGEADMVDPAAFRALIRAAVRLNTGD